MDQTIKCQQRVGRIAMDDPNIEDDAIEVEDDAFQKAVEAESLGTSVEEYDELEALCGPFEKDAFVKSPPEKAYIGYLHLPNNHPISEKAVELAQAWYDDPEDQQRVVSNIGGVMFARWVDKTDFTVTEATAYVLSRDDSITWDEAAELMEITRGNFSGKVSGDVMPKIDRARKTMKFVDRLEEAMIEDDYDAMRDAA